MDDRRLTLIVVPHGDLETRTFEISYGRLKMGLGLVVGVLLFAGFFVATWFPVAAQASRVQALVDELKELEGERAKVAELAQTLALMEAQYERVRQMLGASAVLADSAVTLPPLRTDATDAPPAADGSSSSPAFSWPLPTANYGTRSTETSPRPGEHPGLDIAVAAETQIRSAADGVIEAVREDAVYGKYLVIDHGSQLETLYGHISRALVREGDRVTRGQVIALAGSTGRATEPHLHFEVRKSGRAVDPLPFVRQP